MEVRPWQDILPTLDSTGTLHALPFMPEMLKYCGRRFRVLRRVERTCTETEEGFGAIRDAVFLHELRCDGSLHGGCQKGCMLFWKEAWLREVTADSSPTIEAAEDPAGAYPFSCTPADGQYICQSTELRRATTPITCLDLASWLRSLAATYSARQFLHIVARKGFLLLRHCLTRRPYGYLEGPNTRTPVETLNLAPGDWVQVKPKHEIAATLDRKGRNQGLAFTSQMVPFCGKTFRVRQRLDRMINEPTRRLIQLRNTVTLEGVVCEGGHVLRGGCPRANFYFWREAWLRRVPAPDECHSPG